MLARVAAVGLWVLVAGLPQAAAAWSIARNSISEVVRADVGGIRRCYTSALARRPDLAGTVSLEFVIAPEGRVRSVFVAESAIDDEPMLDCLVGRARRWRFPVNDSGEVTVRYPIHFAPGEGVRARRR